MKQDKQLYNVSRRKLLAGLGTIGVASAGAGLGTTAFFNDTESFTNNRIAAGSFDLKMDYRMTYDGGPGRLEELRQRYANAELLPGSDGVYVLDQQPKLGDYPTSDGWERGANGVFQNGDGVGFKKSDLIDANGMQLIEIGDVKPGDSGEVTFSVHLYDNPGYLWMHGMLSANDENGQTEPEGLVDHTTGAWNGELADEMMAEVWYDDNCDNELQSTETGEPADVMLVIDTSGSMGNGRLTDAQAAAKSFVDNMNGTDRVGLTSFGGDIQNGATIDQALTTDYAAVKTAIDGLSAGGVTPMAAGIDTAASGLNTGGTGPQVMVLLSDGEPNDSNTDSVQAAKDAADAAKADGIDIYTIGLGVSSSSAAQATLIYIASTSGGVNQYYAAATSGDLAAIYGQISQVIQGEKVIASGSLKDVLAALKAGIPLDADLLSEKRQCYSNRYTRCFGFKWWVPTAVGNEIQTDSVAFNLGFYGEQCRHNDGTTNPFATSVNNSTTS